MLLLLHTPYSFRIGINLYIAWSTLNLILAHSPHPSSSHTTHAQLSFDSVYILTLLSFLLFIYLSIHLFTFISCLSSYHLISDHLSHSSLYILSALHTHLSLIVLPLVDSPRSLSSIFAATS